MYMVWKSLSHFYTFEDTVVNKDITVTIRRRIRIKGVYNLLLKNNLMRRDV